MAPSLKKKSLSKESEHSKYLITFSKLFLWKVKQCKIKTYVVDVRVNKDIESTSRINIQVPTFSPGT